MNGLILLGAEQLRRRSAVPTPQPALANVGVGTSTSTVAGRQRRSLESLSFREAGVIGFFQSFALLAGISRSGITLAGGLLRGLDHEDAAKFAFLLATPVIFAAGVLKLPSLAGTAGNGIHGQLLAGAVVAGVASLLTLRYLERYFRTRTLTPFAVYCLLAGGASVVRFV